MLDSLINMYLMQLLFNYLKTLINGVYDSMKGKIIFR